MTKAAALEAAAFDVRVNAVAPGPTDTGMLDRFTGSDDRKAGLIAGVPLKRVGKPDEIAKAIVFLGSDQASFMTGAPVIVDGGMADNPRPIIYGARHRPEVMSARDAGVPEAATLVGRSCENDEMGDYALPRGLAAGDLLALRTTGAYTYSMASNYNRFGRPPVVFVRDGHHRRVVRGESPEDVAARDLV